MHQDGGYAEYQLSGELQAGVLQGYVYPVVKGEIGLWEQGG